MNRVIKVATATASVIALSASTAAFAQDARVDDSAPSDETGQAGQDIVVTGTLIRGIAPAGSNTIGISQEQISATGVSSTNQLLARLPQAANFFNTLVQPGGGVQSGNIVSVINRPNLHNLPGASTSGGALTLILIDGHRVVGAGIGMVAVDPDVVPPGAIERVEAITDGGSAIYGSDAVGGVLNFITRKRFDGVKVAAHYGFADDYQTYDANVIAGKDWGSGSAYISYAYSKHDPLYGIDRDYVRNVDWNPANPTFGLGQNRQCDNANVSVGSRQYPAPSFTLVTSPARVNTCDISDYQTLYMENRQHHMFASLTQELSDWLRFDLQAYYTFRKDTGNNGPARGSVSIRSTNPFYHNLVGTADAGAAQTVNFSYGPALGNYSLTTLNTLETWNIAPSFTADLGGKGAWQLRALFNYGESTTKFDNIELFTAAQNAAVARTDPTTALNPYDIAHTPAASLKGLLQHNLGLGRQRFLDVRAVLDGTLLTLPGGEVKVAVGGEYANTNYIQQKTDTGTYTLPPQVAYRQTVTSAFGEIQIPIFGDQNGFDGMRELLVSASGRYDKYNDFGHTFNPKLALTWKPADWITFTGNWGKSFRAPSPADQLGPLTAQLRFGDSAASPPSIPNNATYSPPLSAGRYYAIQLIRGSIKDITPEKSTNWSVGARIKPPVIPGLSLGASYYRIDYVDAINSPIGTDAQAFFTQFPNLYIVDPTAAQVAALAAQIVGGPATLAANIPNASAINKPGGPRVAVIFDARARNLGVTKLGGIDFDLAYQRPTEFGSVDFSFAGNVQTLRKQKLSPSAPVVDLLTPAGPVEGRARWHWQASAGADIGRFRGQATLYHTSGFPVARGGTLFQDRVGAFNVVNLYLKYDFGDEGIGKDLTLSVNIDNLFNTDPPLLRDGAQRQNGFANGFTIGRLVQFGVSKKF